MNKKAVEGEPLRYLLIIFLMTVILTISYSIINVFNDNLVSNDFRNDAQTIFSKMDDLKYGNSMNSWDTVLVKIPKKTYLIIQNETNCLSLEWKREIGVLCTENNILNNLNLSEGTYTITIYYGDIIQDKNLTLFFK